MLKRIFPVLLLSAVSAQATTILSENFDELKAALNVTSAGAFTAIDGTNIDIVGAADGWGQLCHGPESGNCVDLNGTGGDAQGILASGLIMLDPGVDYFLSFDLIGSDRGATTSTTVSFGSYSQTFILGSSDVTDGIITNALVTVNAPTQTQLIFTSNQSGNIGSVLDNVTITSSAISPGNDQVTATPELPSAALSILAIGIISLPVWKRRRAGLPGD